MEPKISMSWFAIAVVIGTILLALAGHPLAGLWTAVGVGVLAAFLNACYLIQRRAAKRMPEKFLERRSEGLVPAHRRTLDRWTRGQWVGIIALGAGGSAVIDAGGWRPFADVGLIFTVLVVGWTVLWTGVYVSSLVDWFLIMPKVAGISCPAPCERPGEQRWAGITALWCFHRGFARLLVPAVVIGCPTVIGALSHSSAGRAISFAIAATLALYLADIELEGKAALSYGLNPRRYVGDAVWLIRESRDAVTRVPGYLTDLSAEGGKFKYLDETGSYTGRAFATKHDDDGEPIELKLLNKRLIVEEARAPCADRCTGVNWYCWKNPLAHSQSAIGEEDEEPPTAGPEQ